MTHGNGLRGRVVAAALVALASTFGAGVVCAQNAAQDPGDTPALGPKPSAASPGHSVADAYRGMMVCEQAPGAADILHVPLDIAVRGSEVQFARPLFDLQGTRVLGSELGDGSIDASGAVHVTSTWEFRGIVLHGDYSGTLTAHDGILTGTQSWQPPQSEARSRTCHLAVVPATFATQRAVRSPE